MKQNKQWQVVYGACAVLFLLLGSASAQIMPTQAQLDKYLNAAQEQKTRSAVVADTVAIIAKDSASIAPQGAQLSIYEKIVLGKTVVPDSLLRTLAVFGNDVFARKGTAGSATMVPVPASYPIGAGDEIVISLYGRINEENRLRVDRNGSITVPRIGPITVSGQSFAALQQMLQQKLQSIEGVNATVTMGELRSIQIYVVGEVTTPGLYVISPMATIVNALFAAGGTSKMASLRNISLMRNGRLVQTIDFYDFLLKGKNESEVRLQPNDVIVVPLVRQMAAIAGNVRRSAIYEFTTGATLKSMVELAGGFSASGWKNRVQVQRMHENAYQTVLDVDATSGDFGAFAIADGDLIKVFPVIITDENVVSLQGNVQRPGKYALKPGATVADLLPDFSVLMPETYFDYAIVQRFDPPLFLARVVPFNLKQAIQTKSAPDNIALQSRDVIVVFSRDQFEPDRTVTIDGSVNNPGKYKLLDNMRVRDLVLQAQGFTDDASPERGEIYRRTIDKNSVATTKTDFCVSCAMDNDDANNLLLQKTDRVFIRSQKGWQTQKKIVLAGEFVYPGTYILCEGEALGALIERAGGFTPNAYRAASVFTRESVRSVGQKRQQEYIRQLESDILKLTAELASKDRAAEAQVVLAQQQALLEAAKKEMVSGRVVIDLENSTSYRGFALEDGDLLIVPRNLNTVSVMGEVFNPATFSFNQQDARAIRYVQMSGGFKQGADRKSMYIIKANGSIVSREMENVDNYTMRPGDAVVVPQQIRYSNDFKTFMDSIESIAKIAATLLTVLSAIVIINTLSK